MTTVRGCTSAAALPTISDSLQTRRACLATLAIVVAVSLLLPLGPTVALSLLLIGLLAHLLYRVGVPHGPTVAFLLLAGYLSRAAIAFGYEFAGVLPYRWDDYSVPARAMLENLRYGLPIFHGVEASVQTKSYALFRASINLLLGQDRIYVMLVNAFLACLGCLRVFQIGRRIGLPPKAHEGLLATVVLLPSGLVFTTLDMRDPLIFFLTWDALLRLLRLRDRRQTGRQAALLMGEITALGFLRHYSLLIYAAIAVCFALLWLVRKASWSWVLSATVAAVAVLWLVGPSFKSLADQILAYADAEVHYRASGGSSYVLNVGYSNWGEVFRFLPERLVHFTFGPFLWSARGSFLLLAAAESMLVLLFTAPALLSRNVWRTILGNSDLLLVTLFSVSGLAAMATVDSNYGTAIRHRLLFLPGLLLLGCLYWMGEKQERASFSPGVP